MIKKSRNRTKSRSKRGGQVSDPAQVSYPAQASYPAQVSDPSQESNWLNNSWDKIKSSTNNLLNSITGPKIQNEASGLNQEKPWYKFWGGRRRTKSRKLQKTRKKRCKKL